MPGPPQFLLTSVATLRTAALLSALLGAKRLPLPDGILAQGSLIAAHFI